MMESPKHKGATPEKERSVILRPEEYPYGMDLYFSNETLQRGGEAYTGYLHQEVRIGDRLPLTALPDPAQKAVNMTTRIIRFIRATDPKGQFIQTKNNGRIYEIVAREKSPHTPARITRVGNILKKIRAASFMALGSIASFGVGIVAVELARENSQIRALVKESEQASAHLDRLIAEQQKVHAEYIDLMDQRFKLNLQFGEEMTDERRTEMERVEEAARNKMKQFESYRQQIHTFDAELNQHKREYNERSWFLDVHVPGEQNDER